MAAHAYHPGPPVDATLQRGHCIGNAEEEDTGCNQPVRYRPKTVAPKRRGMYGKNQFTPAQAGVQYFKELD